MHSAGQVASLVLSVAVLCIVYARTPELQLLVRGGGPCCGAAAGQGNGERLLAFRWGDGPRSAGGDARQDGLALFLIRGTHVYARAWVAHGERQWPPVEGVGWMRSNRADVVFRSASGLPGHDFYHARCRFDFSPDWAVFNCSFEQRAMAESGELTGGAAHGERVPLTLAEARDLASVRELARRTSAGATRAAVVAGTRCPVFPENTADPSIHANADGVDYHFCCPSCRVYFLDHHGRQGRVARNSL